MILRKVTVVLAAMFAFATYTASAQVFRSGNIVTCVASKACTEEVIDGQRFFVLETPQMTVKVAATPDSKYSRVAVSLENRSTHDISVSPAEFRIEVSEPKFKRLSYIEPANLKLPKAKGVKAVSLSKPTMASSFMGHSAMTSAEASGVTFLTSAILSPSESANGEVFFERGVSNGHMSLFLPIGGVIFEFPYTAPAK